MTRGPFPLVHKTCQCSAWSHKQDRETFWVAMVLFSSYMVNEMPSLQFLAMS